MQQWRNGARHPKYLILIGYVVTNLGNSFQVVLDKTYTIGSVLQTESLSNIAIQLSGTISLSTDLSYWQKNSIQLTYQDAYTAWAIGGTNIHVGLCVFKNKCSSVLTPTLVQIFGGGTYNGGGDGKYSIILQNRHAFADQVT